MIEDRRGVGNFQVDALSFKVTMAPYLATDKIKVEVVDMNLKFNNEPKMSLRTGSNSEHPASAKKASAHFKEIIGYLGPLIKEHMRK